MNHRIHHPPRDVQAIKAALRELQALAFERAAQKLVPVWSQYVPH